MGYDNWKLESPPLREVKEEKCYHCFGEGQVDNGQEDCSCHISPPCAHCEHRFSTCQICNGSGTILTD